MYNADKWKPHKILWLSAKEALFVFPFHNSNVWGARFLSTFTSHYLIKAHHPPFHFIFKRHFYSFASRLHITLEAVLYLSSDRVGETCKYRVDTFPFMGTKAARWWILRWIETYSLCSYMTLAHTRSYCSLGFNTPSVKLFRGGGQLLLVSLCITTPLMQQTVSGTKIFFLHSAFPVLSYWNHPWESNAVGFMPEINIYYTTFFHKWPLLESVFFVSKYRKWYLYTFNSW